MSNRLARVLILAILASLRASSALPQEASPVALRLKAAPGDSWVVNHQSLTRIVLEGKGLEQRIAMSLTVRTTVEAVAPSGRMTLRRESKVVRLFTRTWEGKSLTASFDSDKAADRDAARSDSEGAKLLELLGKSFATRIEQEPTGELRRFQSDVDPANAMLEQMVTEGMCTLPGRAVRIGERWNGGTLSTPMAGLGRIDVARQVVFDSIGVRNGERVANLKATGQVTVKADAESGANISVASAQVDEIYSLAIDRGRMVGVRVDSSIKLDIAQGGQHSFGLVEVTAVAKEQR